MPNKRLQRKPAPLSVEMIDKMLDAIESNKISSTIMSKQFTLPTFHSNGTGAQALLSEYRAARLAIKEAISKLEDATFNRRDFYPQQADSPEAWTDAKNERYEAFRHLQEASNYCEAWEAHAQDRLDQYRR